MVTGMRPPGEPHLGTAYAVMMSYWEVVHVILLLTVIHRMFTGCAAAPKLSQLFHCVFTETSDGPCAFFYRKSYRSLALLWAGSSIANEIVVIPGVVIGKYGSNIRPAFWRNVPFFLVPFWAASQLFRRPKQMPVVTADKTQWCHIGASLHSRTSFTYRAPADKRWPVITLNVLLAIVPALLALRCCTNPAYFMKPVPKGQTNDDKKKN
ncbi:hypothetical protein XENOCAPTIV_012685 [Xenoophorus captivus]|uniref:Transmembrane 6 superfamily member 1/2 transmembrane domain-containing protein n=1 Tax=Xenoophorus captivus TaxID=1517983 RepID=A0ABV0RH18_9TELE